MAVTFNQNFVPGWNDLYANIVKKVGKTIITANRYQSPFSQMIQNMEVGEYIEDIHINPGKVLLFDTVINSDILTNYTDDIATAVYSVNVDLTFPSTYSEYCVRPSFTLLANVSELLSALTANIRTTLEYRRNELVKQMLYNCYQFGMMSSVEIDNPTSSRDASGQYAVALNNLIDDFRTEINTRNICYNNQIGITEAQKRRTIATDFPYIVTFNQYIRDVEFLQALNLGLVEKFRSGNSNMDWQSRIINLNLDDFPKSIPATNRSDVTGDNVSADNINFYEMPKDKDGTDLFSGTPTGKPNVAAFVIDPAAIKLFTQLEVSTTFLNAATLNHTNREIYRGIMEIGAFAKICAVTFAA